MLGALPDDINLHVVDFCAASCVGSLLAASRAQRDLLKKDDLFWCGRLVARWPREGAALCSVRPRATARQLYRAFDMRKDARTNILRRPERCVGNEASKKILYRRDCENADPDRLVFIVCVGPFAGEAKWDPNSDLAAGVRWEPDASETRFDDVRLPEGTEWHRMGSEECEEAVGVHVAQTLHVIDMRTLRCVTLFSDMLTWSVEVMDGYARYALPEDDGNLQAYSSDTAFFRHNLLTEFPEDYGYGRLENLYDAGRLGSVGAYAIEHTMADPTLQLFHDDSGVLRLKHVHVNFAHGSAFVTMRSHIEVSEFFIDMIEQTHDAAWLRAPHPEDATNWFDDGLRNGLADNRRRGVRQMGSPTQLSLALADAWAWEK